MQKIDLTPFNEAIEVHNKKIADLRKAMEAEIAARNALLIERRQEIRQIIVGGKTTGNVLHDECLRHIGFGDPLIQKILEFSKKLEAMPGKLCLITFRWQIRVRFSGPGDSSERDYAQSTGHVLGTLTGGRLEIIGGDMEVDNSKPRFILPFSRFVTYGIDEDRKKNGVPQKGPYTLVENFGLEAPGLLSLKIWLSGEPIEESDQCEVILDPSEKQIPYGLLQMLHSPTEEEMHLSSGI